MVSRSGSPHVIAVDRTGTCCAVAGWGGVIKLWNPLTGRVVRTLTSSSLWVDALAFSPDGSLLVSGGATDGATDGAGADGLTLWDAHAGAPAASAVLDPWERVGSASFSPSGEAVAVGTDNGRVLIWRSMLLEEPHRVFETAGGHNAVEQLAFSLDGRRLYGASSNGSIHEWDVESGRLSRTFYESDHRGVGQEKTFVLAPGNERLIHVDDFRLESVDLESGEVVGTASLANNDLARCMVASPDSQHLFVGGISGDISIVDSGSLSVVAVLSGHTQAVTSLALSESGDLLVSASSDGTVRHWNVPDRLCCYTGIYPPESESWLMVTDDGYWDGSRDCGDLVAMVGADRVYGIDQFAVRNNRPDIILERLPGADRRMIRHYRSRHEKRLRRLGLNEERLTFDLAATPEARIVSSTRDGRTLILEVDLDGKDEGLKSWNLWVNDVPLFGALGRPAAGRTARVRERVRLCPGENKIEVSCMSSGGAEAFRPSVYATYGGPARGDLYFVGFGVSNYLDGKLDLDYAHKDAEDLARLFGSMKGEFRRVVTRVYTDEQVTRANIAAVKELLLRAAVEDTVVLFISGHGAHDRDAYATYYYLVHETDLENLSRTAIDFERLEDLLQGIPPRRKLFLMDTCGSGEVDPEAARALFAARDDAGDGETGMGVRSRLPVTGGSEGSPAAQSGSLTTRRVRRYLQSRDRYIHNDLKRRSGAVVFSSCRGDEVSYESDELENGLFTEFLVRGLEGAADRDSDGTVGVDELRSYVRTEVSRLTESDPVSYPVAQHPTVDRDNIFIEFGFRRTPGGVRA